MRHIEVQIHAKLQPMQRFKLYETPIDEALEPLNYGYVDGGGTLMEKSGEIKNCDITVALNSDSEDAYDKLIETLSAIGLPKGSLLTEEGENQIELGDLEGLGLYINGTDLPQEVYDNCDVNYVVQELGKRLEGQGSFWSFWQGPKDTALYFYGKSFDTMVALIRDFLQEYPLCEKSKIVRIA